MIRPFDVAVLGSGFAGSLLATILQSNGCRVIMVDSARHPRFAIGESSTPAAGLILRTLIDRYDLRPLRPLTRFGTWRRHLPSIDVGCKLGFTYLSHSPPNRFEATKSHRNEFFFASAADREYADTQWYRPDIDRHLAELAQDVGVRLIEGVSARIEHAGPHRWRIKVEDDLLATAAFVVDGTGRAGLLAKSLDLADQCHQLRTHTSATFGHFKNVPLLSNWMRDKGVSTHHHPYDADDSAVHHVFDDGWMWQLRFESNRVSLGWVQSLNHHPHRSAPSSSWADVLHRHHELIDILRSSNSGPRQASMPGRIIHSGRIQRLVSPCAGRDWAMLPSTAGTIDPLHSTGIAHSLSGVERIASALLCGEPSKQSQQLELYANQLGIEFRLIDRIVSRCYTTLGNFDRWKVACMGYFALATHYERYRSMNVEATPAFLLADDSQVQGIDHEIDDHFSKTSSQSAIRLAELMERSIEPINHIGLFRPERPNLYSYRNHKFDSDL